MSKKLIAVLVGSIMMVCFLSVPVVADHHEPKHKIKDVMKKAMKGGLWKKVASGDASDAEKKELHEMFVSLSKHKPPKGEEESWKKLTTALVKAGKAGVEGDAEAGAMLKKATNCKACHSKHKP